MLGSASSRGSTSGGGANGRKGGGKTRRQAAALRPPVRLAVGGVVPSHGRNKMQAAPAGRLLPGAGRPRRGHAWSASGSHRPDARRADGGAQGAHPVAGEHVRLPADHRPGVRRVDRVARGTGRVGPARLHRSHLHRCLRHQQTAAQPATVLALRLVRLGGTGQVPALELDAQRDVNGAVAVLRDEPHVGERLRRTHEPMPR